MRGRRNPVRAETPPYRHLKASSDGTTASTIAPAITRCQRPVTPGWSTDSLAKAGIKGATRAATLYLLPDEQRRLKRLAVDLDLSLHELVMTALDRLLADHGQPPVRRYAPRKKKTEQ